MKREDITEKEIKKLTVPVTMVLITHEAPSMHHLP